jgi:KUP system potassium uptake protein
VEKLHKGFYTVKVKHGFLETHDVSQTLDDAGRLGLALDVAAASFFIGSKKLVSRDHFELSRWRNWFYHDIAGNAPSPARFCPLPSSRVIELGTRVAI